jgi:putative hemolysin
MLALQRQQQRTRPAPRRLTVGFARTESDIEAALRLRYRVFAEEQGAHLAGDEPGIDRDEFDAHCEHLIARDEHTGETVGTYRVLSAGRARQLGRFYSDGEFDLSRLAHLRAGTAEVGRSCVHPDYRSGATIALLWSGLAAHVIEQRYEFLIGCASVGMADGGVLAHRLYNEIRCTALSPSEYRVFPRCPLPVPAAAGSATAGEAVQLAVPPLIKGYLRLGAYVCGEPAWDPDFNTADLLMLLPVSRIAARYANHFLKPLDVAA